MSRSSGSGEELVHGADIGDALRVLAGNADGDVAEPVGVDVAEEDRLGGGGWCCDDQAGEHRQRHERATGGLPTTVAIGGDHRCGASWLLGEWETGFTGNPVGLEDSPVAGWAVGQGERWLPAVGVGLDRGHRAGGGGGGRCGGGVDELDADLCSGDAAEPVGGHDHDGLAPRVAGHPAGPGAVGVDGDRGAVDGDGGPGVGGALHRGEATDDALAAFGIGDPQCRSRAGQEGGTGRVALGDESVEGGFRGLAGHGLDAGGPGDGDRLGRGDGEFVGGDGIGGEQFGARRVERDGGEVGDRRWDHHRVRAGDVGVGGAELGGDAEHTVGEPPRLAHPRTPARGVLQHGGDDLAGTVVAGVARRRIAGCRVVGCRSRSSSPVAVAPPSAVAVVPSSAVDPPSSVVSAVPSSPVATVSSSPPPRTSPTMMATAITAATPTTTNAVRLPTLAGARGPEGGPPGFAGGVSPWRVSAVPAPSGGPGTGTGAGPGAGGGVGVTPGDGGAGGGAMVGGCAGTGEGGAGGGVMAPGGAGGGVMAPGGAGGGVGSGGGAGGGVCSGGAGVAPTGGAGGGTGGGGAAPSGPSVGRSARSDPGSVGMSPWKFSAGSGSSKSQLLRGSSPTVSSESSVIVVAFRAGRSAPVPDVEQNG
jgi:hypothetical protein